MKLQAHGMKTLSKGTKLSTDVIIISVAFVCLSLQDLLQSCEHGGMGPVRNPVL